MAVQDHGPELPVPSPEPCEGPDFVPDFESGKVDLSEPEENESDYERVKSPRVADADDDDMKTVLTRLSLAKTGSAFMSEEAYMELNFNRYMEEMFDDGAQDLKDEFDRDQTKRQYVQPERMEEDTKEMYFKKKMLRPQTGHKDYDSAWMKFALRKEAQNSTEKGVRIALGVTVPFIHAALRSSSLYWEVQYLEGEKWDSWRRAWPSSAYDLQDRRKYPPKTERWDALIWDRSDDWVAHHLGRATSRTWIEKITYRLVDKHKNVVVLSFYIYDFPMVGTRESRMEMTCTTVQWTAFQEAFMNLFSPDGRGVGGILDQDLFEHFYRCATADEQIIAIKDVNNAHLGEDDLERKAQGMVFGRLKAKKGKKAQVTKEFEAVFLAHEYTLFQACSRPWQKVFLMRGRSKMPLQVGKKDKRTRFPLEWLREAEQDKQKALLKSQQPYGRRSTEQSNQEQAEAEDFKENHVPEQADPNLDEKVEKAWAQRLHPGLAHQFDDEHTLTILNRTEDLVTAQGYVNYIKAPKLWGRDDPDQVVLENARLTSEIMICDRVSWKVIRGYIDEDWRCYYCKILIDQAGSDNPVGRRFASCNVCILRTVAMTMNLVFNVAGDEGARISAHDAYAEVTELDAITSYLPDGTSLEELRKSMQQAVCNTKALSKLGTLTTAERMEAHKLAMQKVAATIPVDVTDPVEELRRKIAATMITRLWIRKQLWRKNKQDRKDSPDQGPVATGSVQACVPAEEPDTNVHPCQTSSPEREIQADHGPVQSKKRRLSDEVQADLQKRKACLQTKRSCLSIGEAQQDEMTDIPEIKTEMDKVKEYLRNERKRAISAEFQKRIRYYSVHEISCVSPYRSEKQKETDRQSIKELWEMQRSVTWEHVQNVSTKKNEMTEISETGVQVLQAQEVMEFATAGSVRALAEIRPESSEDDRESETSDRLSQPFLTDDTATVSSYGTGSVTASGTVSSVNADTSFSSSTAHSFQRNFDLQAFEDHKSLGKKEPEHFVFDPAEEAPKDPMERINYFRQQNVNELKQQQRATRGKKKDWSDDRKPEDSYYVEQDPIPRIEQSRRPPKPKSKKQ